MTKALKPATKKRTPKYDEAVFAAYCRANGIPTPKAEHQFHPTRKWRIDFYFEHNGIEVALEVEGGVHGIPVTCNHCGNRVKNKNGKAVMQSGGRHTSAVGFANDCEKYNWLTLRGIWLLRVTPKTLMTIETIKMLKGALEI